MKKTVQKQRQLRFDEINALVKELTITEDELATETPEHRRKRKDRFWDSMLDWMIDGFASGLLFLEEDFGLPEEAYSFLNIEYKQTGETVEDIFDKDQTSEADMQRFLECECNRMFNTGVVLAGKNVSGITKTWETMGDEKVRDTHWWLEGETIPYEEEFITFDGDSAQAPGMFQSASNNVNCRCWLTLHKPDGSISIE